MVKFAASATKKERFLPYAATLLFYIATYIVLIQFPVKIPFVITGFILLSAFSVFVTMLINLKTKISAHAVGIACFFSYIMIIPIKINLDIVWISSAFLILIGLVATARLSLNAHKPVQIYLGLIAGFIIGSSFLILKMVVLFLQIQ